MGEGQKRLNGSDGKKKNLDFLEQIVSKNIDMKDAGKKML